MIGMWILAAFAAAAEAPAAEAPPAEAPASETRAIPVHVGGRAVRGPAPGWRFGWPGTYFEGRFEGSSVTVRVDSAAEHLRLFVDGEEKMLLQRPGSALATLSRLAPGIHTVRLEKLTESQTGGGRLIGFFAGDGGKPLPPRPRARRIEFIGDSYTVGYGNASPGRACTAREVHDRTDTQRAFGPLLAKRLDADYRVIAYSGFGIVRNYAGGRPGESLPGIYHRSVPDDPARLDTDEGWWPQVIVINLGTNDFSTPLKPGEPWASANALRAAWRERYVDFAESLLSRRPEAQLVLMGSDAFQAEVEQVAAALNAVVRAKPVATVRFGGLELTGCDHHPSLADHEALAGLLEEKLAALPQVWR